MLQTLQELGQFCRHAAWKMIFHDRSHIQNFSAAAASRLLCGRFEMAAAPGYGSARSTATCKVWINPRKV
jgi:hypothetical protein